MSKIGLKSQAPTRLGLGSQESRIGMSYQPTQVIPGEGGSLAVQQFYNVNTACEMPSVPLADITAWLAANWDNPSAPAHSSEDLKTLIVDKNGDPMETLLDIPDIYQFKSVSSTEITNYLADIWPLLYV
jgi:hypothetical protein